MDRNRSGMSISNLILPAILLIPLWGMMSGDAAGQWTEKAKLLPNNGGDGFLFGFGVAVDSQGSSLVGAPWNHGAGYQQGSIFAFHESGGNWIQSQQLLSIPSSDLDWFGWSIDISESGEWAVVGAPQGDFSPLPGSAYVYRMINGSWTLHQKLSRSTGYGGDKFGFSVSISGDTIVVGSHSAENGSGDITGAAYVYQYEGNDWIEKQKLIAFNVSAGDQFGYSVSISGDAILIGAPYKDTMAGTSYVFRFQGQDWQEEQELLGTGVMLHDQFGQSVSLSGEWAAVGSMYDSDIFQSSGSVYLFRYENYSWYQETEIHLSDAAVGDTFGHAVAISGNTLLAGAYQSDALGNSSGAAYAYYFNGLNWGREQKLLPSDGAEGDNFGVRLALSGNMALIGAAWDDDQGLNSGSAYIFDLTPPPLSLQISPSPLLQNQPAQFQVSNGSPLESTWLVYSTTGGNCTFSVPQLHVVLDLCPPGQQGGYTNPIASGLTDSNGDITWTLTMPAVASPHQVWFQAIQDRKVSPVVQTLIQ